MEYEAIRFEREDSVAILTLNRPQRMNAWTGAMALELSHALGVCNSDDAVRVIVLTGAGRAFCAGADLGGGGDTFGDFVERRDSKREPAPILFPWQIDKPVIAAINGHAIGVGITYPMMCDIRFVAADAKIQFAFVRRGILPELASHAIVARVAGLSNAADLLLSGRMIRGSEAAELGLASAALPYLVEIAEGGLDNALRRDEGLAAGVVLYRGMHVHPRIAATVGAEPRSLASLLEDRS